MKMQGGKAKKYGCPLYSAAWVSGSVLLMAGGGGKKTSGIKNKVLAVVHGEGGELSDECAAYLTGDSEFDVPYRLEMHPGGKAAVVSMAGVGGCRIVDVVVEETKEGSQEKVTVAINEKLTAAIQGSFKDVGANCVSFAGDSGETIMIGLEDGRVLICEYPKMTIKSEFMVTREAAKEDERGVKDMDVAPKSTGPMLATTSDEGECTVWSWPPGQKLASLVVPTALKRGRGFSACRFARDTDQMFGEPNTLYTVINAAGNGHLLAWKWGPGTAPSLHDALKEGWSKVKVSKSAKVTGDPITCMEVSPSGRWIAVGNSDGDVVVCNSGNLRAARRVNQAHLVFSTGLAWAPDGSRLVSVSGDASAALIEAPAPPGLLQRPEVQVMLALLVLLLAVLLQKLS
eukprot:CAMPEP_0117681084 /NCGR_PEP_ID=MMETSP0804-20121206/18756_1 /TAXON_ID=1074897 /ORGANISM="Tetraselmis astigmatica, Strain CCMP880" /LENGTH=399 /DNA_ID=CAMNT_0005490743 /DNA_START=40 /DNA_END=1239 /DNA_ORIENTATION=+